MIPWPEDLIERFWSKVDKSGDCWIWTDYVDRQGYGRFRQQAAKPKSWPAVDIKAHRAAYWLATNMLPEVVMHVCDNPPCVRHLRAGTRRMNTQDMINKGRHKPRERKFSDEQEDIIRDEYARGGISYRGLAAKYDTSYGNIQWVMKRGVQRQQLVSQ